MEEYIVLLTAIFQTLKALKVIGDNSTYLIAPNSLKFPQTTTIFLSCKRQRSCEKQMKKI